MAFKSVNRRVSFGKEGKRGSFQTDSIANFGRTQSEQKTSGPSKEGCLGFGPFGSRTFHGSNSGATSLPTFGLKKANSNIYNFELGSTSPTAGYSWSTKESGPSSMLTFGMEPKQFSCHSNPFCTEYLMDTSQSSHSGGSSRTSSGNGSTCSLFDWGGVVENVFKEEIGKMAQEFHWGTGFGGN